MELGFEVVYCNFSTGLKLATMTRVAHLRDSTPNEHIDVHQWARAVVESYDGISSGRVHLDFSSMVSAFFFPVNTTNTDPRKRHLPRLAAACLDELRDIRTHVRHVFTQSRRHVVDWQAVADLVVARFSSRLALMASPDTSTSQFVDEVEIISRTYFDVARLASRRWTMPRTRRRTERPRLSTHARGITFCRRVWSDETGASKMVLSTRTYCGSIVRRQEASHGRRGRPWPGGAAARGARLGDLEKATGVPRGQSTVHAHVAVGEPDDYRQPGCRSSDVIGFARRGYWSPYDEV